MQRKFTITLNEDQVRVLSSYMTDAIGDEMPTITEMQRELQNVIDRALEAYGDAIGDPCPVPSTSLTTSKSN